MTHWATETFAPRVDITLSSRYATQTTCECLVASLSNAVASVDINSVNYPITWTELGADVAAISDWTTYPELGPKPVRAGYIGSIQVTGLTALTEYPWTVSQSGNVVSGNLTTKPDDNAKDPYTLWYLTCDAGMGVAAAQGAANGTYKTIADYKKSNTFPLVSLIHIDDYGYLSAQNDETFNDYLGGDADRTGLAQYDAYKDYAVGAGGEYMGAVSWFNYLNLTGYKDTVPSNWYAPAPSGDTAIRSFSGDHRDYIRRNTNVVFLVGDWEFRNDMSWDSSTFDAGFGQTSYETGRRMQDLFVTPFNPPAIPQINGTDRGIVPMNWSNTYSNTLQIVSPDGITNGNGAMGGATVEKYTDPVLVFSPTDAVYGTKQIDDVLTIMDNTTPFKHLGLMYGLRYPILPFGSQTSMGCQHALADHDVAEYEQWFVESGNVIKSLMDNPNTNGTNGKLTLMHGDTHNCMHHTHRNVASAGILAENFDSLYLGTANQSGVHGMGEGVVEGASNNGTTLESIFAVDSNWSSIRVDVRVDLNPVELHYYVYTETMGNEPAAIYTQTADGNDSALNRIDTMSKTYRDAYTPDANREVKGNEIISATKQDTGDEPTGMLVQDMVTAMNLQILRNEAAVSSTAFTFTYQGVKSPVSFVSSDLTSEIQLSSGNLVIGTDGAVYSNVANVSAVTGTLRTSALASGTLMFFIGHAPSVNNIISLGGNYYFYAAGYYFRHTNLCGITQTANDAYARFPATTVNDSNTVSAMALYYDPNDQTNCRKFVLSTIAGIEKWQVVSPNLFGPTAMSGSFLADSDFELPKAGNPMFGFYKLPCLDMTITANQDILRTGLAEMIASPLSGMSRTLAGIAS